MEEPDLEREWLLADGAGGFAMGTRGGPPTRRYHAWMIAALDPPVRRTVLLRGVAEGVHGGDGESVDLWSACFGDDAAVTPEGWRGWSAPEVDRRRGWVRWTGGGLGLRVERVLSLRAGVAGAAGTVTWTLDGAEAAGPRTFWVRPWTPLAGFHALEGEAEETQPVVSEVGGGDGDAVELVLARRDVRARLRVEGACGEAPERVTRVEPAGWWHELAFPAERARGLDWRGDVWSPGSFAIAVPAGGRATLRLRMETGTVGEAATGMVAAGRATDEPLAQAARDFVVVRRDPAPDVGRSGASIVAGYPWFADWGRDAMIALPGLLLVAPADLETAGRVLRTFAATAVHGLLPNCFHDAEATPRFNAADASPWFVHAVDRYLDAGGADPGGALVAACRAIVERLDAGTDFGIGADPADGLLRAGAGPEAVTWMDAVVDGRAITPRHGKAVEIQGLWVAALRCVAARDPDPSVRAWATARADRATASFRARFVRGDGRGLFDRIDPDGRAVAEVRSNQVIAAALGRGPVTGDVAARVLEVARAELLTPYGLRTLARDDPAYRGRHDGPIAERDESYHQGTVWPWLIGPMVDLLRRVEGDGAAARAVARRWLAPLRASLAEDGCDGQLAEVYDGDPPHRWSGCPAQAWSVAEVRRASAWAHEDDTPVIT